MRINKHAVLICALLFGLSTVSFAQAINWKQVRLNDSGGLQFTGTEPNNILVEIDTLNLRNYTALAPVDYETALIWNLVFNDWTTACTTDQIKVPEKYKVILGKALMNGWLYCSVHYMNRYVTIAFDCKNNVTYMVRQ
jgi:hypothetical protein